MKDVIHRRMLREIIRSHENFFPKLWALACVLVSAQITIKQSDSTLGVDEFLKSQAKKLSVTGIVTDKLATEANNASWGFSFDEILNPSHYKNVSMLDKINVAECNEEIGNINKQIFADKEAIDFFQMATSAFPEIQQ